MPSHPARVYHSLNEFLTDYSDGREEDERYARMVWKKHIEKHGNVPLILKCSQCSGADHKFDIKSGKFKISTRSDQRIIRDELNKYSED
jgi:hypothetical protein